METIRRIIVYNIDLQCRDSNWDTRKKIVQSQHFFDKKILDFSFFCKQINNIHKFEGCFPKDWVSSNVFKFFNCCIVEFLNCIGLCAKKTCPSLRIPTVI